MTLDVADNRTIEQRRAAHALAQVQSIANREYGHYVSYVSRLPATIVMNGLGQALTMLLAAAGRKEDPTNDPHRWLYDHVASWLSGHVPELQGDSTDHVIRALMEHDQAVYVRAQGEAMAYLQWLKQFARAYLREAEGQE